MTRGGAVGSFMALCGVALVGALVPLGAYAGAPALVPAVVAGIGVLALIVRYPEYGLALTLSLAPWTNLHVADMRPLRVVIPIMAIALLAWGVLSAREVRLRHVAGTTVTVLFFAGVAVLSAFLALDPASSVNKLLGLLTAVLLFLAVLQICQTRRQLAIAAGGLVAGLFLAGAQGIVQQLSGQVSEAGIIAGGEVIGRVEGSFGHPNQYAGILALLIPLAAVLLATRTTPPPLRMLALAALAVGVPAIAFAYSRAAIVAAVLGSLLWLASVRPRAALGGAVAVVLLALALAPPALRDRFEDDAGRGGDVALRADLWGSALDVYSQRPLLGVGVDNFTEGYAQLPATLAFASQRRLLHQDQLLLPPHSANLYLNVLAELGILGLLALGLLMIAAVGVAYRGSRLPDPLARTICQGIGAGTLVVAIHGMFEVPLFTEISQPFFAMIGIAAGFVALHREEPAPTPTAPPGA